MSLGFTVLLWLHAFGAIGWLGAAMVFGMLIAPTLPSLAPASRGELIVKLFPKYIRYATVFAVGTPVVGIGLVLQMGNGSFSVFTPNTNLGIFLTTGAFLTLVVWAIFFGLVAPSAAKVVKLTQEVMKNPGPPPPGLVGASKRLRIGATLGLVMLILVFTCMVAAASL